MHLFSGTHRKVDHETGKVRSFTRGESFRLRRNWLDAAEIIAKHPMALHLRFLQSLVEVSAEKNSTIIFPVPLDLLAPFLKKSEA